MTFKVGQINNPNGRRGEYKFLNMLERCLEKPDKKGPKLERIADKLIAEAIKGRPWAIDQVINRIDGKALERVAVGASDDIMEMFRFVSERTKAKLPENQRADAAIPIEAKRVE